MRHSEDLFNASESIITPVVEGVDAAASAAAASAAAAVSNGVKSVQLQSSALTPGRGRAAVQGGAWGKVEVKTRCVEDEVVDGCCLLETATPLRRVGQKTNFPVSPADRRTENGTDNVTCSAASTVLAVVASLAGGAYLVHWLSK